jgi:hypothetical protein
MSAPIWSSKAWWVKRIGGIWSRWKRSWTKETIASVPIPKDRNLSEEAQLEVDLEVFKVVVEHFRHNLEIFWQHYILFIAIQGALLTVATDKNSSDPRKQALAGFGILLSAFWWWIGWRRWKLIELWREEVMRLDLVVDRHASFFSVETKVRRRPLGIPAFSALFLPPLIGIGWIVLFGMAYGAPEWGAVEMSLGDWANAASVFLAGLAVVTLFVAWRQWQEVVRRRRADMYWRLFDVFESEQIRDSSTAFDEIEKRLGLERADGFVEHVAPADKKHLSSTYWRTFYQAERESDDKQRDRDARARIRFFAATGVLLKARLVDPNLVFGLIGPALDVDRRLLDIIIAANRIKHRFPTMFQEVYDVDNEYERWKKGREGAQRGVT